MHQVNWATRRTGPPRRHNPEQNAWGMGAMGGYGMPAAYGYGMPGAYDPATAAAWAQYYQVCYILGGGGGRRREVHFAYRVAGWCRHIGVALIW